MCYFCTLFFDGCSTALCECDGWLCNPNECCDCADWDDETWCLCATFCLLCVPFGVPFCVPWVPCCYK